ncbi:GNAT family N-acetyltransferase [Lacticaseibacillus camelliae]|uniref:GNAT family N-acetyltransferase n=1 Tax=Lacticaseibacillus camelliae TaxID=381742 RepID=UPI0006D03905|nr:GNAT family N-acetyltransferase [Lacticaseibacillus camelliae]
MNYTFESALTIHEIKALYGAVHMTHYLNDPAETARGIANSTLLTARDGDKLVGVIRGVSDMHTIVFVQDLIVLPEYQHQGIGTELLDQFDEYFKQVDRIVIVTTNEPWRHFTNTPASSAAVIRRWPPLCGHANCLSRSFNRR